MRTVSSRASITEGMMDQKPVNKEELYLQLRAEFSAEELDAWYASVGFDWQEETLRVRFPHAFARSR